MGLETAVCYRALREEWHSLRDELAALPTSPAPTEVGVIVRKKNLERQIDAAFSAAVKIATGEWLSDPEGFVRYYFNQSPSYREKTT